MNNFTYNGADIILLGAGGHSSVLLEILISQGQRVVAVCSRNEPADKQLFGGIVHLSKDNDILDYHKNEVVLVNGVGMLPKSKTRLTLTEKFENYGFCFRSVIHSSAIVSTSAKIKPGAQILAHSIVQSKSTIGRHSIINNGAIVDHHCEVGDLNHIATGATLCGNVITGPRVFIGAGATIINSISLCADTIVPAGTVITKNLLSTKDLYHNHK